MTFDIPKVIVTDFYHQIKYPTWKSNLIMGINATNYSTREWILINLSTQSWHICIANMIINLMEFSSDKKLIK